MSLKTLFLLIIAFLLPVIASAASVATPYSSATITYPASQPGTAGTRYPVPTLNSSDSTTWGWRCTVTGGIGLTFDGNSPFSKDGCLHTRILQGGLWVQIDSSLRAANPLQPYHSRAYTLRTRLKDALSYGRHIFFQGRTASQESAFLADSVNPELTAVSAGLTQLVTDLQALTGLASYYSGQIAWAAPRFTAAAGSIASLGTSVDSTELANLRNIQIALEIATEALDAEPGARVLSMIAWDSTSQQFVIFGGDHLDYQMNDLWIFNPAIPRWEQRHAANGPCPRADHFFTPADSGRIKLTGGYGGASYSYNHVGPDIWYYDVANNTWIKPPTATAYSTDLRTYRGGNLAPEFQMSGAKPNAATNEAFLAGIPSNTWVNMNPPVRGPGHRDWGSLAYDAANDMIYTYSGGHVAYNGTDVLAYHIATNRYEVPVVPEFPLGRDGANESAAGWTMSKRPWLGGHTWNGIEYHPILKRMVLLSREEGTPDNCIYYYDPIRTEWTKETVTPGMSNSKYSSHACYTSLGMLSWFGNQIWKLDDATLQWQKLNITGTMPGTVVDNCGLVYDSKRNCIYFFTKGYSQPYSGVVHKLDLATLTVSALTPANAAFVSKADPLREVVYLPNQDLVVFAGTNGYHKNLLVYDPTSNLWRSAKVTTPASVHAFDVSASIIYDTKRDLIWYLYNNYNSSYIVGDVHVLKIDKNTLILDTIKADVPAYMTLSPDSSIIAPSGSIKLSTSLWCADSTPYTGTTLWSVENGGAIDANGLFTSNGTIGRFSVRAKAAADTMVSVNGTVYVLDMAMRFKFNDGTGTVATDSVATGMAGTFDGSLISWCKGKNDSGICFNGTGHSINRILFKNSRIRFQNNFTMSFWAKPTGATPYINNYDNYNRLLIPASGGAQTWGETSAGIGLIMGNNSISLYESPSIHSASTTQFKFDTTFADWTHITIAYTNRVPKLYINGKLVKTGTTSVNTIVRPSINLGGDYRSWYIGSIDELTLFTRTLSDAEIMSLAGGVFTGEEKSIPVDNGRMSLRIAPNPCNPSTLLRVSLPGVTAGAKLSILNAVGQVVATWDLSGRTGVQQMTWNGADMHGNSVATGVYLVNLQAGKHSLKQRLMLVR